MLYIFEFKTKIADLEIKLSENYIEEIKIKNSKSEAFKEVNDRRLSQNGKSLISLGQNDYNRFNHLYGLITLLDDYFSSKVADFAKIPVNFSYYGDFTKKILFASRFIGYGERMSYKELAQKAGFEGVYSRACANALSINKTPIVIPCHRVITSSGKLGGYSAGGGVAFKAELLSLERQSERTGKNKNL